MNTEVTQGMLQQYDADTLIVNLFENTEPAGATAAMNEALGGEINRLRALGDFKGTLNSVLTLYPNTRFPAERIIVVGLGKQSEFSAARAIEAVGTAVKEADRLLSHSGQGQAVYHHLKPPK